MTLGFGATQSEAVATAEASLHRDFDKILKDYAKGWERYDKKLNPPPRSLPGISRSRMRELRDAYYLNINVVKAAEDKTFPGAIVAGLSSPWGQAVSAGDPNNTYFGSYREVFSRDLYEAWTGLMAAGDTDDGARRDAVPVREATATRWLDAAQLVGQRQDRAGLVRHATRRGRLPDPDGASTRPHRRARCTSSTSSRLPTSSSPAARRSAPSDGRSSRASRRRRSPPRSPDCWPAPTSPTSTATPRRHDCGARSPTTSSDRSRAGRSRPTARSRPIRTSSACRRPVTRTRPSATTSATADRRSTSAT